MCVQPISQMLLHHEAASPIPPDFTHNALLKLMELLFFLPSRSLTAPALHLPMAAALRTHAVTWAANMVVQEAVPSSYYDHDVNTLGVLSLQHDGRQHGRTDGVCFNTLVALLPDYVRRDEDGEKVEATGAEQRPPALENPRYVWHLVHKQSLREKLLEKLKNTSILPLHSLY